MQMGLELAPKGKISLEIEKIRGRDEVKRIVEELGKMKLAYYPGCVSRSTGKEMDASTRAVCTALGIELEELEDWNCCGATHVSNELVATGLAARNMAQTDLEIMTACSICYSNLRTAALNLEELEIREKVNAVLEKKYSGARIRHALDVILEDLAENDERIVVPLKGLKVAPYYGCLLTRPDGHLQPGVSHHPGEADHDPAGGAYRLPAQDLLLRRAHLHAPGRGSG